MNKFKCRVMGMKSDVLVLSQIIRKMYIKGIKQ